MSNITPKIDLHSHWFSPNIIQHFSSKSAGIRFYKQKNDLYLDRQINDGLPRHFKIGKQWFDIEQRIKHLQQHQVIHQLISWPTTLEVDRYISIDESHLVSRLFNDDLSILVHQYPDFFSGLVYLSTSDLNFAKIELQRGHEELGLIGGVLPVALFSSIQAIQQLVPLFEVANHYKSHIYLHTGSGHPDFKHQVEFHQPDQGYPHIKLLESNYIFASSVFTLLFSPFLDQFPHVTIQIAMLGGSGTFSLLLEQILNKQQRYPIDEQTFQRLKRIYFDTGAAGDGPHAITATAHIIGINNIVFGTDYAPQDSVIDTIQHIAQSQLSDIEKQHIFFDTPLALLQQHGQLLHVPTLKN